MDTLKKIAIIIGIAAVLYGAIPLFGRGYIPTHDGEYHILRIVEFAKMLGRGYVVPRWAPDLNSGYGIPIFNYHYPLPNYIGSFVRVFTRDAVIAFQMSQGIGYTLIAAGAYLWLAALFGTFPAIIGAVVTAFVPYLFVDVYVRGSIGEVWATAFLLFTLFALEKKKYVRFAIFYGLLILSHNILAMLFTPFILGYALIRNKKAVIWMLGGIGISSFFWIPAILESKYVVGLNTVNFREHFVELYQLLIPSWGTEFSGSGFGKAMSVQIGLAPILVVAGALFAGRKHKDKVFMYMLVVLTACIFFMLPVSEPVWEVLPPLQLIQYPWRFLSFVMPVAGFSAAFWVSRMKHKWWGLLLAVVSVALAASYARPVLYAPRNEAYYLSRPNFTRGTSSMGNSFSTIWSGWKDTPATVSSTLYFPGWKAYVGGKEVPIVNDHGVIRVAPGEGEAPVLRFGETPLRALADIISVVSLGALLFYAYRNRHHTA